MAKKESTFINMTITLFLVTLVSSASLAFVYELTKEKITTSRLEAKKDAIKKVLPGFTNNPLEKIIKAPIGKDTIFFYPATKDSEIIGYAAETFTMKGFGGKIQLMVGFKPNGIINKIAVLKHNETPGLGDKMEHKKSGWSKQFEGKNPDNYTLQVSKDGGDVDAITAATISSRAFCDAVQKAVNEFDKKIEK